MNKDRKTRRPAEKGIALLIAIFVLLLISVVAIALLVSSGTETALGANYRASSSVYYAALAGLEEARGRLSPKNPTYLTAAAVPTPFPLGQAVYVMNRLSGENVVPWDTSNQYYDKEFGSEFFPLAASSVGVYPAYSVWDYTNSPNLPGPMYKWVRITAATEQSLYLDVDSDNVFDNSIPIYYDPAGVDSHGNPAPSLIRPTGPPPSTAVQVLQITALAYLPNGSQKLLQYVVAPTGQSFTLPAALTMDGPNVGNNSTYPFVMPIGANFVIDGTDTYFSPGAGGCVAGNPSPVAVRSIGYTNTGGGDLSSNHINSGIAGGMANDFVGSTAAGTGTYPPNVYYVGNSPPTGPPTINSSLQTLAGVNSLATSISQTADVTLVGPVTQSDASNLMPAAMSATNPMTVVVNGDFTENGWSGTGYGILLVTGTFDYDPNSSWNGVILVIGKGVFYSSQSSPGTGKINGAVFVAKTTDAFGNPLPPLSSLGSPTANFANGEGFGNQGIYYSSCWVQYVQSASKYRVLSFHEIPQS
jgi:hypothetical protein